MIEIVFEGDWRKAKRVLNGLPISLKAAATEGQKVAAEKLVKIVVGHIKKQDLGWAPLSESGARNDDRIMIDSGTYLRSIQAWKSSTAYMAGVPKGIYNPRGNRVADYAVYNEFGYGPGPARPLWGPSIREMGGSKGIQRIIANTMRIYIAKVIAVS